VSELVSSAANANTSTTVDGRAAVRSRRLSRRARLRELVGIRGKLFTSYMGATLVLVVGLASFGQMQLAEDTAQRADLRQRILSVTYGIQNELLIAEAAHRGFLLTHDERYLDPQRSGPLPRPLDQQLDQLTRLSAAYPMQNRLATRIVRNVRVKLARIDSAVAAVRAGRDPLPTFQAAQGEQLLKAIQADAHLLISEVRALREAESNKADLLARFAKWFIVVGNAIAFCLAAAVTFWIGKAFNEAHVASKNLAAHSRQLEDHAQRLAAQEKVLAERLEQERELRHDLERSNRALARSNADLEQFAYVASHDLRAPLRGIASLSDWLEEDLGTAVTPPVKKHIDTLRGRVGRLDALITGIATYSRAGRREEAIEAVAVADVVRDVVDLAIPPSHARVRIDSPLPVVSAPRTPLQQIFLNLVSNAVKHGAAGSDITIACADDGTHWRFSVSDRGPGIAREYQERIFGLFQRLKSRDEVEGTGIGLALVKKLVERYGGRVWVESAPGEGATFSFTWPKSLARDLA
jgi:signal transduction histidine kinase